MGTYGESREGGVCLFMMVNVNKQAEKNRWKVKKNTVFKHSLSLSGFKEMINDAKKTARISQNYLTALSLLFHNACNSKNIICLCSCDYLRHDQSTFITTITTFTQKISVAV